MEYALMGMEKNEVGIVLLKRLLAAGLQPRYVVMQSGTPLTLAASAVFLHKGTLPGSAQKASEWGFSQEDPKSLAAYCAKEGIPFFAVPDVNGRQVRSLLISHQVDVLLLADCPILRGPVLYMPRFCAMNIQPAPLPQYRGKHAPWMALYHNEPPMISAHVVTPRVHEGPILKAKAFCIHAGDNLEEANRKALIASADLAVEVLGELSPKGFHPTPQRSWEGMTYSDFNLSGSGESAERVSLENELRNRLDKKQYGFYGS